MSSKSSSLIDKAYNSDIRYVELDREYLDLIRSQKAQELARMLKEAEMIMHDEPKHAVINETSMLTFIKECIATIIFVNNQKTLTEYLKKNPCDVEDLIDNHLRACNQLHDSEDEFDPENSDPAYFLNHLRRFIEIDINAYLRTCKKPKISIDFVISEIDTKEIIESVFAALDRVSESENATTES